MTNHTPDSTGEQEIWKQIPIGSGLYLASTFGRIKNVRTGKITLGRRGTYYTYHIKGASGSVGVHRLVALTFLGSCPRGAVVNHKDLNKLNNHLSNLEYVSKKRNAQHAADHYSGITDEAIQNRLEGVVELRSAGWSYEDISLQFGIPFGQVRSIVWEHREEIPDDLSDRDRVLTGKVIARSLFDGVEQIMDAPEYNLEDRGQKKIHAKNGWKWLRQGRLEKDGKFTGT